MELKVRQLMESDWDTLVDWWSKWPKWTAPAKGFLPDNGTVGLMVYKDNTPIVAIHLEFIFLTSPDVILTRE